jgi:hypothetical protein
LQLWNAETVRGTIDNPVTDPDQREELIVATGGWPSLCEKYLNLIRGSGAVADVIEQARSFPLSNDEAKLFLSAAGLTDGRDLALLGPWAFFASDGDDIDEPMLKELMPIPAADMTALLEKLIVLSIVSERGRGYMLNDVVRRCLVTIGAPDAV